MAAQTTKDKIIDHAEQLFAAHGYAATSIRQIVKRANVNLAAIHYHFGSKEKLFMQSVGLRFNKLNAERSRRLEETTSKNGMPSVGEIINAFLVPLITMEESGSKRRQFSAMIGRAFSENPELKKNVHRQYFKPVCDEFIHALSRALPEYSIAEIHWRFHFLICTMVGALMAEDRLDFMSDGQCCTENFEEMIERLTQFVTAGLNVQQVHSQGGSE